MSDLANDFLRAGLSVIPIHNKVPTGPWKEYQTRLPKVGELSFNGSIGLICGHVSDNVEAIDVDVKNDLSRTLMERLTASILEFCPDITEDHLVIQQTPSGGCHLVYKCEVIQGNQVLARSKDKKTLIETRGEGGYIAIDPTPGYQKKRGDFLNIQTITPEQRERLLSACRSLNEYFEEIHPPQTTSKNQSTTIVTPWKDFDNKADGPQFITDHSWTFLKKNGENLHYCRPGKKGSTSGTWNESKRLFYCFTSSTELEPNKAYSPSALYAYLECNGDFSEAARRLYADGYGERLNATHTAPIAAAKHGGTDAWLVAHVFLMPSMISQNKFAHVLVDEGNICTYYESTGVGKPSEPLREKISSIRALPNWPKFDNEGLKVFDESWVQRDTADECFLYYRNGTVKITRDNVEFINGSERPMVWGSLVLQRNYKKNDQHHEIARLAELATVNYLNLKIAIGYLLHRHWRRNMTKLVWACDHKPSSKHDGRRGKDLFTTLVSLCRKWTPVKWKRGANFWTSSIQPDTAIVHFEDVNNALAIDEEMKKTITGDFSIEHKGMNIVTRKFSDKPKFSASSQKYPLDYMDASIRGRIWLVEFTDYLQKNPPKKTLVYDDTDLSSFDSWMIDCVQTYFKNVDQLIGVPDMTTEQRMESLRVVYGNHILNAVQVISEEVKNDGSIQVSEVLEALELDKADGKTLQRFKEAFEKVTGKTLCRVQRRVEGDRVPYYSITK